MHPLTAAGYAYDDMRLNAHLRDWDVSEARDRAIEARTRELLDGDYTPFGERVVDDFCGWPGRALRTRPSHEGVR